MILLMPNKECYHVTYLKFVCYRMSYNESLILQQTKYNKLNRKRIAGPGIEPLDEQATFTVYMTESSKIVHKSITQYKVGRVIIFKKCQRYRLFM